MRSKTQRPAHRLQPIGTGETLVLGDGRNDNTAAHGSQSIPWPVAVRFMTRRELEQTVDRHASDARTRRVSNDLDGEPRTWRQWPDALVELDWRDAAARYAAGERSR